MMYKFKLKINDLDNEISKARKLISNVTDIRNEFSKQLRSMTESIKDRQNMIEIDKKFTDLEKKNKNMNLIDNDERQIIFLGMDKADYTYLGHPKFRDLGKICNEVIRVKLLYPNTKLKKVCITFSEEIIPPNNYYSYEYIDNNNVTMIV